MSARKRCAECGKLAADLFPGMTTRGADAMLGPCCARREQVVALERLRMTPATTRIVRMSTWKTGRGGVWGPWHLIRPNLDHDETMCGAHVFAHAGDRAVDRVQTRALAEKSLTDKVCRKCTG